jgi:hypothetical protein
MLDKLSKSIIIIYSHNNNSDSSVSQDLAKHLLDSIIKSEHIMSDPGMIRGKALNIDIDLEQKDATESDIDITVDETFDPFSLESTGLDVSELESNTNTIDD